jgi:membrane protein implicated in regulation of membrane protease activity
MRRINLAILILATEVLLAGLSSLWAVILIIIASRGAVSFVEGNPLILALEITATLLIVALSVFTFALQLKRLGERRSTDERRRGGRRE